ncbi:MAG: polyketide synthase dehydratase domain-containing protein, partial [Desulfuromonadaceae bacterium]
LRFHGFNDLRILKGVILDSEEVRTLQVMTGKALKADGFHVVPVELSSRGQDGRILVHARAKMVLATRLPEAKAAGEAMELPPYARSMETVYSPERLFHGPAFHGIAQVLGCSDEDINALVKPTPLPSQWIEQPLRTSWLSDPLALDSSFQMMILWSFERYEAGSLPVFAGRYRPYVPQFPAAGSEIRIHVTQQNQSKAAADINFVDPASGQLLARIEDYECVIDASLNKSFQHNKLQGAA